MPGEAPGRRGDGSWHGTGVALVVTAAAFVLFFPLELFTDERAVQWDAYTLHYPFLSFAARSFQAGRVPLWSPEIFCGYPILAQLQMAPFHPLHAAVGLWRHVGPRMVLGFTVLQYLVALWGTVALARAAGASPAAATVAALAYALSGPMLGHASHLGILECNALLPAALALALRGDTRSLLGAGLVSSIATFAGHFQSAVYGVTIVGGVIAVRVLLASPDRRGALRALRGVAIYLAVVASVTAVQSLPTAELAAVSLRKSIDYQLSTSESLKAKSLTTMFRPHRFGGIRGPYTGPWDRTNQQCYGGLALPLLVVVAIVARPRRTTLLLAGAVLLGVLFALGDATPVHRLVLALLPGFSLVRTPAAMMPMVQLGLALLAASGADRLPRRLALVLPLVLFVDLAVTNRRSTLSFATKEAARARESGEVRDFLAKNLDAATGARIHVFPYGTSYFPNEGLVRGQETTFGRASGLYSMDVNEILELAKCRPDVLDLLRVAYVVDGQGASQKGKAMALGSRDHCPPIDRDRQLVKVAPNIHRNDGAAGVVLPVTEHRVVATHEEALAALQEMDLRRAAVVEEASGRLSPTPGTGEGTRVEISKREPHRLDFQVDSPGGGLLVITETYYPGWRAEMDGQPAALLRADGALRAVVTPPGRHAFRLTYAPASFRLGLFVTCASFALVLGAAVGIR